MRPIASRTRIAKNPVDNGDGLPAQLTLNGLRRLSDRLLLIGGSLELVPSPLGGARVIAVVPDGRAAASP